jgi:predicted DNA-binding ArsR family transcriptional regulator
VHQPRSLYQETIQNALRQEEQIIDCENKLKDAVKNGDSNTLEVNASLN